MAAVLPAAVVAVTANPVLHKVGGSKGWINRDVNYTDWSTHEQIFLGDWLCKYTLTKSSFSLFRYLFSN